MNAIVTSEAGLPCLRCHAPLSIDERLLVGEVLHCGRCNAQHEVFDLDPLLIGPRARIEEEEEDFEGWPKAG